MAGGSSEDDMEPKTRNSAHRSGRGTGDSKPPSADTSADILLVYDMECPACDTYCRWVRLRPSAGRLHLVNARESTAVMEEITMARLDIDQGMGVETAGRLRSEERRVGKEGDGTRRSRRSRYHIKNKITISTVGSN